MFNFLSAVLILVSSVTTFAQTESYNIKCVIRSSDGSAEFKLSSGSCVNVDNLLVKARQNFLIGLEQSVDDKRTECDQLSIFRLSTKNRCSGELGQLKVRTKYLNSAFTAAQFSLCSREINTLKDRPGVYIKNQVQTFYSNSVTIIERYAILPETAGLDVGVKISGYKDNSTYDAHEGERPNAIPLDQADLVVSCK